MRYFGKSCRQQTIPEEPYDIARWTCPEATLDNGIPRRTPRVSQDAREHYITPHRRPMTYWHTTSNR